MQTNSYRSTATYRRAPVESMFTRRLKWQAVQHGCTHFETRLMQDTGEIVTSAQSPCSECAPQGRPVRENYETVDAVLAACVVLYERDGRP